MSAWSDWTDLNDEVSVNGAEIEYYESLDAPYQPRNGKLETVEELVQIRGFADVFEGIDLDAAFTLYGDQDLVNLNVTTVEAMQLLPGLDDELIQKILLFRQEKDFTGNGDVAQLVSAENMALLRPWLSNLQASYGYYTIMAYKTPSPAPAVQDDEETDILDEDASLTAFSEIVQISSFTEPPKVLKITPYQKVPIRIVVPSEDNSRQ